MSAAGAGPFELQLSLPLPDEVQLRRRFAAPREALFEAFTRPERVQRWCCGPEGWSLPVCRIEARCGGCLRYEWAGADGRRMGMSGRFIELRAPERLVHFERFDEDWTEGETRVATEFGALAPGLTLVTVTIRFSGQRGRDRALACGMTAGMAQGYRRLDALLLS